MYNNHAYGLTNKLDPSCPGLMNIVIKRLWRFRASPREGAKDPTFIHNQSMIDTSDRLGCNIAEEQ